MSAAHSLSNLQQELLKLYAANVSDADLQNIKHMLGKYFAEKAMAEADKVWDEKGYSADTMNSWLNGR